MVASAQDKVSSVSLGASQTIAQSFSPNSAQNGQWVEVGRAWAQRSGSGSGFLLNKTPSPSPKGLKIGQSPMGPKIEPFRPEGPKKNF
jgi:hypothetical protein